MSDLTIFWHDYETWGVDPRRDRASQFAGIRTNADLEIIGEPVMLYCKPTGDFIPHPDAVRVTRIAPQKALNEGLNEAAFFGKINELFSQPGTCVAGYNSIRFDDEVSRFGFYRNFIDPYAREWQNGNSRWDILDLVRMTHALRPDGINWPERPGQPGTSSFRLEHLTAANQIEQRGAHDALVDVRATIKIARLIREKQPRLYDYYFNLRQKNQAAGLLDTQSELASRKMVLHISGMFPAETGCLSPVLPLLVHPENKNEVICYDLRQDPTAMLGLSIEQIEENLYRPAAERDEQHVPIPLKGVHLNKSPALSPPNTLTDELAERWQIDWSVIESHRQALIADNALLERLNKLYARKRAFDDIDADAALYAGFVSNADRQLCNRILASSPQKLASWKPAFESERLKTLYPRYRARNWPETLNEDEQHRWQSFCKARLLDGEFGSTLTLEQFQNRLEELALEELDEKEQHALKQLVDWVQALF